MRPLSFGLCIGLLAPTAALAIPVTGTSSGIFSNPTGPPGMVVSGIGTNHFTWGTPTPPSSLIFNGNSIDSMVGDVFSMGRLIFTNGVLNAGTEAQSVDLTATLMLTLPGVGDHMLTLPLTLINTPNTSTDPNSPDFVVFPVSVPSQAFSANGMSFAFEFVGFGVLNAGEMTVYSSIGVTEGHSGTVLLLGRVAAPEPSTLLLLAAGFAALAARRRSSGDGRR